jgi:hypothetical protein
VGRGSRRTVRTPSLLGSMSPLLVNQIRFRAAIAGLLTIFSVSGCGQSREATAYQWRFAGIVSDSTLQLTYLGSPCQEFQTARVTETRRTVKIVLYEQGDGNDHTCQAAGIFRRSTVKLASPLEDRQLLGCEHPSCVLTITVRDEPAQRPAYTASPVRTVVQFCRESPLRSHWISKWRIV